MVNKKKLIITVITLTLGLSGCAKKVTPPEQGTGPTSKVFVVNANPETIGVYDVEEGEYRDAVLLTGDTPNYMFLRDSLLYLVNSGYGGEPTIQAIDPIEERVLKTIILPNGSNPMRAIIMGSGNSQLIYFTSWTHHRVYVIDLGSETIIDSMVVGKSPDGITELNGRVYIVSSFYDQETWSVDTGKLYGIDPNNLTTLDSIVLGINPSIVVNDGEYLYVGGGDAFSPFGYIEKVNPQPLERVSTVELPDLPTSILSIGNHIWVSVYSRKLYKIGKQDLSVLAEFDFTDSLPEGSGLMGMDTDTERRVLYISSFLWNGLNYMLVFDIVSEKLLKKVLTGTDQGTQIVRFFSP